jgi:capsular exopolysaccharide synthesis family protein
MSRIQNILEKAERDGSVRRIRSADSQSAVAPAGIDGALYQAPPPAPVVMDAIGAAVTASPPVRSVAGARLDRRLLAAIAADSLAAEQYRALRTRIFHADNGAAVHVVLITSPGQGDGKTLTASNLGLTMAQDYQRRICVVDADLRHPQLQRLFGLPDGPGLSDVLAGEATLEEALVAVEDHQITILPAGRTPVRPAELLGTTAMRRTIETLRSQFDRVVVDAPATTPLADVGILTPLVDSVLLVVRSGTTRKPAIHDAVAAIDRSKLLGVVLNDAA